MNKLTENQHRSLCNIVHAIRAWNVEPSNRYDLTGLNEYSYNATDLTFDQANILIKGLGNYLDWIIKHFK